VLEVPLVDADVRLRCPLSRGDLPNVYRGSTPLTSTVHHGERPLVSALMLRAFWGVAVYSGVPPIVPRTATFDCADHCQNGSHVASSSCACASARRARAAQRFGKLRSARARHSASV
jgi:hypothetical protein